VSLKLSLVLWLAWSRSLCNCSLLCNRGTGQS